MQACVNELSHESTIVPSHGLYSLAVHLVMGIGSREIESRVPGMGEWEHGNMKHGNIEMWEDGTWKCWNMEIWQHRDVKTWNGGMRLTSSC